MVIKVTSIRVDWHPYGDGHPRLKYKPELATTLGRCMQGILLGLEAGLEGQPIINTGF